MAQETGTTAEGAGTSGMDAAASNGVGAAQTPASDAQQAAAPADALATARQVEGLLTVKSKYSAMDSVKRVQDAPLARRDGIHAGVSQLAWFFGRVPSGSRTSMRSCVLSISG